MEAVDRVVAGGHRRRALLRVWLLTKLHESRFWRVLSLQTVSHRSHGHHQIFCLESTYSPLPVSQVQMDPVVVFFPPCLGNAALLLRNVPFFSLPFFLTRCGERWAWEKAGDYKVDSVKFESLLLDLMQTLQVKWFVSKGQRLPIGHSTSRHQFSA